MATYLFRAGDGNEGNFPRFAVILTPEQCPFAALKALVLNQYKLGPMRDYIESKIDVDGEAEFGVHAAVYEGPDGESAFGAAWITAELEPIDDDRKLHTLADVLDTEALKGMQ